MSDQGPTGPDARDPDPVAPDPEAERRRRQAPLYGEYATPEEVAALRGPDAEPLVPVEPASPPPPTGAPRPGLPPAGHVRAAGWDGVVTVGLLAYGAVNVVQGLVEFLHFPAFLSGFATAAGMSDVHVPASAQGWGDVLIVAWVLIFLAGAFWAIRRLRRGRIAFWVPLVAGAVASLVFAIAIGSVLGSSLPLPVLQNQG